MIDKTKLVAWLWDKQREYESQAYAVAQDQFPTFVADRMARYGMAMQLRWMIESGEFDDKDEGWDWVI